MLIFFFRLPNINFRFTFHFLFRHLLDSFKCIVLDRIICRHIRSHLRSILSWFILNKLIFFHLFIANCSCNNIVSRSWTFLRCIFRSINKICFLSFKMSFRIFYWPRQSNVVLAWRRLVFLFTKILNFFNKCFSDRMLR